MHTVFVYGTLKAGMSNHHLLEQSVFLGKAYLSANLWVMYSLGVFPAIVRNVHKKSPRVMGELYRVDDGTLMGLDALEGYPDFYDRTTVCATLVGTAEPVIAQTYTLNDAEPHGRIISTGDW